MPRSQLLPVGAKHSLQQAFEIISRVESNPNFPFAAAIRMDRYICLQKPPEVIDNPSYLGLGGGEGRRDAGQNRFNRRTRTRGRARESLDVPDREVLSRDPFRGRDNVSAVRQGQEGSRMTDGESTPAYHLKDRRRKRSEAE